MPSLRIKTLFPVVALFALAACDRAQSPVNAAPDASPQGQARQQEQQDQQEQQGQPDALDQPAENVPPATAPSDVAVPASGSATARMDGYGDMRFGMTLDEFKKAWGGELKGDASPECHYLTPKWVKEPSDFAFMFEGGKFVRYDVGNDRETAPGGGRRGMNTEEILELYAGRVEETPHKYVEGGKYLGIRDDKGGPGKLVFVTDANGKVVDWHVGVAPQVDYVEGCS